MTQALKFFNPIEAIAEAIYQGQRKKEESKKVDRYLKTITTPEGVEKAIKKFTPKNADEAERRRIKNIIVNNYVKNLDRINEDQKKACFKVNDSIIKLAQKTSNSNGEIDTSIQECINKLDNLSEIIKYAKAAENGQRWLDYTFWQLTSKSTLINISNIDQGTMEYVNGICKELHVPRIYPSVGDADLEFYDPLISGFNNQRFLVNTEALKKRATLSFQTRLNTVATESGLAPTKGYSPIKIGFATPTQGNTLVNPDIAVDKTTEGILDSVLNPYINGRIRWYEKTDHQNTFKVVIKNPINGIPEERFVVLGYYGYNILALQVPNVLGMKILVHQNYKDIWEKVFSNCFYQMTEEETNAAGQFCSNYYWIYSLVDFSNIPEENILYLDMKLNSLFSSLQAKGIDFKNLRYRFETFESIDKFALISDSYVVNPFKANTDGSVIYVENNNAIYRKNNSIINVGC